MSQNSNARMKEYRAQAIRNILASAEARKAKALLASASNHLVATKVAYAAASKAVDANIAAGSKHLELWLKKLPSQTQQDQQTIPAKML